MTIHEIEQAITELSLNELVRFRQWFDEFDAQVWDKQFEHDAKSGKLDKLANEAVADKHLRKLQGSLKGKDGLKTLVKERRKD